MHFPDGFKNTPYEKEILQFCHSFDSSERKFAVLYLLKSKSDQKKIVRGLVKKEICIETAKVLLLSSQKKAALLVLRLF